MLNHLIKFFTFLFSEVSSPNSYRIIAVDDSYNETGKISVKVQVVGKSQTFDRPVKDLYQKEWLEKFSREDVAHLAALYTAENTNNLELVQCFPKPTPAVKSSVVIVGILFTAFLILANLSAFKIATIGPLIFPAGLIFFPITYVFDDILTEVYGFKISRRVIWSALCANLIIFLGAWATTYLPPAPNFHNNEIYQAVYQATPRIFIASVAGYFFGEFTNSIILAKLKIFMHGKHLWLRVIASTSIGVGIDTFMFLHIAYLFIIPYSELLHIVFTMYFVKVVYEICAVPITYKVIAYLKAKDNVDHYDYKTNFNPFSLTI